MKVECSLLIFFLRAWLAAAFWVLRPVWAASWLCSKPRQNLLFYLVRLNGCRRETGRAGVCWRPNKQAHRHQPQQATFIYKETSQTKRTNNQLSIVNAFIWWCCICGKFHIYPCVAQWA
jgi:hypothetical protein